MAEDRDIGPDEVRIKTTISTQTPRDEVFEEAAQIVAKYEEIEKRWKAYKREIKERQEEVRDYYIVGALFLGFGIGFGIAIGSIFGFSVIRLFCNHE